MKPRLPIFQGELVPILLSPDPGFLPVSDCPLVTGIAAKPA
jgi:hypothetical protein